MTQTIVSPTASQRAAAEQLLSDPGRWSRGRSKATGQPFWLIQGSKGSAHYATSFGCTCKGFAYRGNCSHVAACRIRERAEQPVRPVGRVAYDDLFPDQD
jgi:hypothetical protein